MRSAASAAERGVSGLAAVGEVFVRVTVGRRLAGGRAVGQIDLGFVFCLFDPGGGNDMLVVGDVEQPDAGRAAADDAQVTQ